MLFNSWRTQKPEEAELVLLHADQFFGDSDDNKGILIHTELDELFGDVCDRLFPSELEAVLEYAVKLVLSRNDRRESQFRHIADRFKMFDDFKNNDPEVFSGLASRKPKPSD